MTEILYKRENFLAPSPLMIPPVELVQLKMRQCNAAASDAPLHMPLGAIDPSSESQAHGRKMLRRVANRRSAQQSRARKKALMGDLKIENARLQKLADILDSQPELTFCVDKRGNIKFISDSALNYMKSTVPEDCDDEPTHINQILTLESVETVLESVGEVRDHHSRTHADRRDFDQDGFVSSVQSVCYHDAHGFQVAGYVRCSRLIKRTSYEDVDVGPTSHTGPPSKKSKSDHGVTGSNQQHQSNSDNDSHNTVSRSNHNSDCGGDTSPENRRHNSKKHVEEEYVCVIRPADASFPDVRGNRLFSSLLSTASMVAHDLELRSSGYNNQADPLAGGWSKEDYLAEGRRGGHYSYDSSDQQQCSGSSNGTKNSTSSETTSEDNGESDDLDAPL